MPDLIQTIKKAAVDAVEATKPVKVLFGEVLSISPLSIKVDQKFILTSSFLIVTRTASTLSVGDGVILLRMNGGQKYVVLDRIGGA